MTTQADPYTAEMAYAAATDAAAAKLDRINHELEHEHHEAMEMAVEYAKHLASGGDPTVYPKPRERDSYHSHGIARIAREAVFDTWNECRERKSIGYPWGQNQPWTWLIQEYMLDRLGEPVLFEEVRKVTGGREGSPSDVANAIWSLQAETNGALRARKVRVNGKVAYLVREAVEDDDVADFAWRQGVYGHRLETMSEPAIVLALQQPFKARPGSDFPQEVL